MLTLLAKVISTMRNKDLSGLLMACLVEQAKMKGKESNNIVRIRYLDYNGSEIRYEVAIECSYKESINGQKTTRAA